MFVLPKAYFKTNRHCLRNIFAHQRWANAWKSSNNNILITWLHKISKQKTHNSSISKKTHNSSCFTPHPPLNVDSNARDPHSVHWMWIPRITIHIKWWMRSETRWIVCFFWNRWIVSFLFAYFMQPSYQNVVVAGFPRVCPPLVGKYVSQAMAICFEVRLRQHEHQQTKL